MQTAASLDVTMNGAAQRSQPTPSLTWPRSLMATNGASSPPRAVRNHLPDERISVTHKFNVGSHEGYLIVGLYPDGQPGELFIVMAKEGSTVSGLISSFAQSTSIGLQHGVPLKLLCDKFSHTRFEPSGWTGNPEIAQASSVIDYIFRWLQNRFLEPGPKVDRGKPSAQYVASSIELSAPTPTAPAFDLTEATDAPSCKTCGSLMRRNGACHVCGTCGWTSGCG